MADESVVYSKEELEKAAGEWQDRVFAQIDEDNEHGRPNAQDAMHSAGEHLVCELNRARFLDSHEFRALERSLAFDSAVGIVDGYSVNRPVEGGEDWKDLSGGGVLEQEQIDDALAYLDARGLLARHPKYPLWVVVLDESEASL